MDWLEVIVEVAWLYLSRSQVELFGHDIILYV